MKKFIFCAILLFFAGCQNPEKDMNLTTTAAEKPVASVDFALECGQNVKYVEYEKLGVWLKDHNNITIVSLCPVDRGGYGSTCGYIIVYTNGN